MAMIKCHECGKEISSSAKTCPNCGVKPKKSVGIVGIAFALFAGFILFKCTLGVEESSRRTAEREAAKTPEQRAAEATARANEELRVTAAMRTQKLVREHAKNPASLQFEQLGISERGDTICGRYRATNSFNAVVPGIVVATPNGYSFEPAHWKKHCANAAGLFDMTSVVK